MAGLAGATSSAAAAVVGRFMTASEIASAHAAMDEKRRMSLCTNGSLHFMKNALACFRDN